MTLSYSSWVPYVLVEERERLGAELRDSAREISTQRSTEEKERYELLVRLTTHGNAQELWESLSRATPSWGSMPHGFRDPQLEYFVQCVEAIGRARRMPPHTRATKRDHLKGVAKKARELNKLLESSPYIRPLSQRFIAECATPIEYHDYIDDAQHEAHELYSSAQNAASTRFGEKYDAWFTTKGFSPDYEPTTEEEREAPEPEETHDAIWLLDCYRTVTLSKVLEYLAVQAEAEAKIPPPLGKPGSRNATTNNFVRFMYQYHRHRYGKPLWSALASATTVALDLKSPLSADDVRPLIPETGRF